MGKALEDSKTVGDYNISENSQIDCLNDSLANLNLDSDKKEPSQESNGSEEEYNPVYYFNHEKAKQVTEYEYVDDPLFCSVLENLQSDMGIWCCIIQTTKEVVYHSEKTCEELVSKLVVLAEKIYEGFNDPIVKQNIANDQYLKFKTSDQLFKSILRKIEYGLVSEAREDRIDLKLVCNVMREIYDCYDAEKTLW